MTPISLSKLRHEIQSNLIIQIKTCKRWISAGSDLLLNISLASG